MKDEVKRIKDSFYLESACWKTISQPVEIIKGHLAYVEKFSSQ